MRIAQIKQRIVQAAERTGRDPDQVKIVAVTKFVDLERINEALSTGITILGENRVQEFMSKYPRVKKTVEWHLIGSLQTNKVKSAINRIDLIHSLDRFSLAKEISLNARRSGKRVKALVQVNVAGESSKRGLTPEEVIPFIKQVTQLEGLEIQGLMTIAPLGEPEGSRLVFSRLRQIFEQVSELDIPGAEMRYLSMGMTNDFEVAVEEGANLIRIGTGIFGSRN